MRKKSETEKQEVSRSAREHLVESLKLPADVCLGAIRVTLTGNREAWIENYRGLMEYSEKTIVLQGKTCQVCLEGEQLVIVYYTNEDMKICGRITCVRYQ